MASTSSLPSRLLTTPMRDLLRLRFTGRLAWRRHLRESGLPVDVRTLIARVVPYTRLWRLEKAEVAEELIAHFSDGLDRGATAADLIEQFGDARLATRLIRRAKTRNRPWIWQIGRAAKWVMLALGLFYAVLALLFYTGRPAPTVDYLARMNRLATQTPPDQLGWPLYRQAMLALGIPGFDPPGEYQAPGRTERMEDLARTRPAAIELIRQAAARPVLGFVLGAGGSENDPALYGNISHGVGVGDSVLYLDMPYLGMPYLGNLEKLQEMLGVDARIAVKENDGRRFLRDVVAEMQMADQLAEPGGTDTDYQWGMRIRMRAYARIDNALRTVPGLMDESELQELAHRLAIPRSASDFVRSDGERWLLGEFVQRAFTGSGPGGGLLNARGMKMFVPCQEHDQIQPLDILATNVRNSGAVHVGLVAIETRRDFQSRLERVMDAIDAAGRSPLRTTDPAVADRALYAMESMPIWRAGYRQSAYLGLGYWSLEMAERLLGHRDGLMVGIALTLFHRTHGHYPASLSELSPALLPQVPADRITGAPVRYRLVNGQPLVYSVGADRVDDGGQPATLNATPEVDGAATWFKTGPPKRGDWILYPQSEFETRQ